MVLLRMRGFLGTFGACDRIGSTKWFSVLRLVHCVTVGALPTKAGERTQVELTLESVFFSCCLGMIKGRHTVHCTRTAPSSLHLSYVTP